MRSRPETFGAIVQTTSPPALVSVDRTLAKRLGIDGGELWSEPSLGLSAEVLSAPTEVHVAVTDRCPAGCVGCYADARPNGYEPSLDDLKDRLRALRELGVFNIAFGGGEAALRAGVGELGRYARDLGLTPTLTTSGLGVTEANAAEFRSFAQVNVSLDGEGEVYQRARGYRGDSQALRAMRALSAAGVSFGINMVLMRDNFDHASTVAEIAVREGARELQFIRYKPTGRGNLNYLARRLSTAQVGRFPETIASLTETYDVGIRIDCALVPFLVSDGRFEVTDLERFGIMGCEAGRSLLSVKSNGASLPCSFWGEDDNAEVLAAEGGKDLWTGNATLSRLRKHYREAPEPCASCPYRRVCRGGCRVVARALNKTPWDSDPECPRVQAFRKA